METLFKDLQFGVRSLLKRPGFTTIAVLTLALGIGANTAIFSVVNATLMRPLPVVDPDRLVFVFNGPPGSVFSYPDYAVMRDQNKVFDGLIAWGGITASLNSNDQTDLVKPKPLHWKTDREHTDLCARQEPESSAGWCTR